MLELLEYYRQLIELLETKDGKFKTTEDWEKYKALKKTIAELAAKTWVSVHGNTCTAPTGNWFELHEQRQQSERLKILPGADTGKVR